VIHVIPTVDLYPHEASTVCACGPRLIFEDGEAIVVHDALSGFGERCLWWVMDVDEWEAERAA